MLKFFIAGIMQGSMAHGIHGQDYRPRLKRIVTTAFPDAKVFCPFETHPESVGYDEANGRRTFFDLIERAGDSDVLIAYLPSASMGTAVEMWRAYNAGRVVVAISRLTSNWAVKFLAHKVCATLDDFELFVASNGLGKLIQERGPST